MKILHNPRCRKSREALAILEEKGQEPEVVLYLDNPPSANMLKNILKMLGIKAEQLIRKTEPAFKENFKGKTLTEKEWIAAMIQYPKLIERPILIHDKRAVIGRPPENVLSII